jgi:Putative auto-transporter adhesin, head GIN domain
MVMKKLLWICILSSLTLGLSAQSWWGGYGIKAKGPIVKKELKLSDINGLGLSISGNVYLRQGATQSITVETHEDLIPHLMTLVEDGYWKIRFDQNVSHYDKFNIYITIPTLKAARISGSGDIVGETAFKDLGNLALGISGSGDIKLNFEARDVEAKISGSGDMSLNGSANAVTIGISGSGDIESIGVKATSANISISGSGNASVQASENLDIRISGSGDVFYKGRPRLNSKVSGSGDVVSRE